MRHWQLKDIRFIRANLHLSDKELAEKYDVTITALKATRRRHNIPRESDGRFKKGQAAFNKGKKQSDFISPEKLVNVKKGQFKKGQKPSGSRPLGEVFSISDGTGKVYKFIKLPRHRQYPYGRYLWEQHFGQKLSKNQVVKFIDGNPENCALFNLTVMTRGEVMKNNTNRTKSADSLRKTWGVVKTFEDFGLTPPYKFRSKRKAS